MRLDHVRLLVADFDGCFRFYRDALGLEVTWGEEEESYASFRSGEASLSLFDRAAMAQVVGAADLPEDAGRTQDRVALIFSVDDLDASVARIQSSGRSLTTPAQDQPDWGIRTAHVRDPDGNLIELNVPLPKERWSEDLAEEAEKYGGG